nr:hypothetical protein CparaKRNrm2_p046 [Cryptomonas paramecium]
MRLVFLSIFTKLYALFFLKKKCNCFFQTIFVKKKNVNFKYIESKLNYSYLNIYFEICLKKINKPIFDVYYVNVLFLTNPGSFFRKKAGYPNQKQSTRIGKKFLKTKSIVRNSLFINSKRTDFQLSDEVIFEDKIKIYISKILNKKKEQISGPRESNFFPNHNLNFSFKNKNEFELILTLNKIMNSLNTFFKI